MSFTISHNLLLSNDDAQPSRVSSIKFVGARDMGLYIMNYGQGRDGNFLIDFVIPYSNLSLYYFPQKKLHFAIFFQGEDYQNSLRAALRG